MQSNIYPSAQKITKGALISITASAFSIFAVLILRVVIGRLTDGILLPIGDTLSVLGSDALTFPVFWLIAFSFFLIPGPVLIYIAYRFRLNNIFIYLLSGLILGFFADVIFAKITHGITWYTDDANTIAYSLHHEIMTFAKTFVPAGAIGGVSFWVYVGRCFKQK